jgi:NAD(P)H-dependent FMN reductase
MSRPVRILGIAGSLRRESYNRAALRAAAQLVPEGATLDIFELHGIRQLLENLVAWTRRLEPTH